MSKFILNIIIRKEGEEKWNGNLEILRSEQKLGWVFI